MSRINRRTLLTGLVAVAGTIPVGAAAGAAPRIHVVHDRNCGCCKAWMAILRDAGFEVTSEHSFGALMVRHKMDKGVPPTMMSCHTAEIEGYVIEGHVPAEDIRRLLAERPEAIGLAVPDMPYGSPGMGPEDRREAYDVFLIRRDGGTDVFSSYAAAT